MSERAVLTWLAEQLRSSGGLLAGTVRAEPVGEAPRFGPLAASGPRAGDHADEYERLVEAIREGYLLHYGTARVVDAGDDDLALLAGDHLYAFGLARLAALGDLEAVDVLSEVIALSAQAHAAGDGALAEAAWEAGACAVGWGAGPAWSSAARLARDGAPGAVEVLSAAAHELRSGASARRQPARPR